MSGLATSRGGRARGSVGPRRQSCSILLLAHDLYGKPVPAVGVISYKVLFESDVAEDKRRKHVRIHGATRGVMLILAANRTWSVSLQDGELSPKLEAFVP